MPTNVAKALWEEYANIIKDKWVTDLEVAIQHSDMGYVSQLARKIKKFKFDFNKSKPKQRIHKSLWEEEWKIKK